jgi:hypothetical protein
MLKKDLEIENAKIKKDLVNLEKMLQHDTQLLEELEKYAEQILPTIHLTTSLFQRVTRDLKNDLHKRNKPCH